MWPPDSQHSLDFSKNLLVHLSCVTERLYKHCHTENIYASFKSCKHVFGFLFLSPFFPPNKKGRTFESRRKKNDHDLFITETSCIIYLQHRFFFSRNLKKKKNINIHSIKNGNRQTVLTITCVCFYQNHVGHSVPHFQMFAACSGSDGNKHRHNV